MATGDVHHTSFEFRMDWHEYGDPERDPGTRVLEVPAGQVIVGVQAASYWYDAPNDNIMDELADMPNHPLPVRAELQPPNAARIYYAPPVYDGQPVVVRGHLVGIEV